MTGDVRLAAGRFALAGLLGATCLVFGGGATQAADVAPAAAADEINGVVWLDQDGDGVNGEAELPFPDAVVTLSGGNLAAPIVVSTGADGLYSFTGLDPLLSYTVTVTADTAVYGDPSNYGPSGPSATITYDGADQDLIADPLTPATGSALATPGVSVDGAMRPLPELELGFFNEGVYDGRSPFNVYGGCADATELGDPGDDCGQFNSQLRSNDTLDTIWSITFDNLATGTNSFGPLMFEQTIDPDPDGDGVAAGATFVELPDDCSPEFNGGVAEPPSQIIDNPDGGQTLVCNLGYKSADGGQQLLTQITVDNATLNGQTFSTSQRVYTPYLDSGSIDPNYSPAITAEGPPVGPIEVSNAPRYDLSKVGGLTSYGSRTFDSDGDGVADTTEFGWVLGYDLRIASQSKFGNELIQQPVTFDDFFQLVDADNNPIDTEYYVISCEPSRFASGPDSVNGRVWPESTLANSVLDSGDCAYERSDWGDTSSSYTLSIDDADLSGTHYPTVSGSGASLDAGPYFLTSTRFNFFVPGSVVDLADGTIDGAGVAYSLNRVGEFDPVSVSGQSNLGDGTEPGDCDLDTLICEQMPSGEGSNNVAGPRELRLRTQGLFGKDAAASYTAGLGGPRLPGQGPGAVDDGIVQPGTTFAWTVRYRNFGQTPFYDPQVCDVFDNTTLRLAPASDAGGPAGSYGYLGSVTPAASLPLKTNAVFEYAHVDLAPDDPLYNAGSVGGPGIVDSAFAGPDTFNTGTGRYIGNWSTQNGIEALCDSVTTWYDDPNDVPGGIDEVNVVRYRSSEGADAIMYPGTDLWFALATEARSSFYGGPHDGELIPYGTRLRNIARGTADVGGEQPLSFKEGAYANLAPLRTTIDKRTTVPDTAIDNSTGTVPAGDPVVWELLPLISSTLTDAVAENLRVIDELPVGVTYDAACTAATAGTTAPTAVFPNTDRTGATASGKTLLVWELGDVVASEPIAPISFCTLTDPLAEAGTQYVNYTETRADNDFTGASFRSDTHTITVNRVGVLGVSKQVDRSLDPVDDVQVYRLGWANFSPQFEIDAPVMIDVLPWNGDGSGSLSARNPQSSYTGSLDLTGAPTVTFYDGSSPATGEPSIGELQYSATDPSLINTNPDADAAANTTVWCTEVGGVFTQVSGPVGGTCPTVWADVTAIKFVSNYDLARNLNSNPQRGIRMSFSLQALDNQAADVYANRFAVDSSSLDPSQFVRSNTTVVTVASFAIGDLVWADLDNDGVYTAGTDLTAPEGVQVDVYLDNDGVAGPSAGDELFTTVLTDDQGRWLAARLPEGDVYIRIPASEFATGGPLYGWSAQPLGFESDANTDQNESVDHNATTDSTAAADGLVSPLLTLSYNEVVGTPGALLGDEPIGDNVAGLPTTVGDRFTNLTLDVAVVGTSSIGDRVWFDEDGDGIQDPDEVGLNGATVTLTWAGPDGVLGTDDDVEFTQTTDGDGNYTFENLPGGVYDVSVSGTDSDLVPTYDLDSGTDGADSSTTVDLMVGEDRTDIDFGYGATFSLGNRVWIDVDGDGVYTDGVDQIAPDGVTVELYRVDDAGQLVATGMTTEVVDGQYRFDDLFGGEYAVVIPSDELLTGALAGGEAAPGGVVNADNDGDDDADHNAFDGTGSLAGAIVSAPITLSADVGPVTGAVAGAEPDGFVNGTLDLAVAMPAAIEIVKQVCPSGATCDPATDDGWVETTESAYLADAEWRIVVRNIGLQNLIDVSVSDPLATSCSKTIDEFSALNGGSNVLTVGAEIAYGCTSTELTGSIDPNTATAAGTGATDDSSVEDSDTASVTVPPGDAAIEVVKSINGDDANDQPGPYVVPGDELEITFDVAVTGIIPVTDVTVTDTVLADADIDCTFGDDTGDNVIAGPLSTGDSFTCVATIVAPAGQHANTAQVVATPVSGDSDVSDTDPAYAFGVDSQLEIVKTVQTLDADEAPGPNVAVGGDVVWDYTVTNTGNVALGDVVVSDSDADVTPEYVSGDVDDNGLLDVDEVWHYQASGVAVAGQYQNTGTAPGTPSDDDGNVIDVVEPPSANDDAHYVGIESSIDIRKLVNGDDANEAPGVNAEFGDELVFDYEVSNTGTSVVSRIVVTDDQGVSVDCGDGTNVIAELQPGDAVTCTGSWVADAEGPYVNIGSAAGVGPETVGPDGEPIAGSSVTDDDLAHANIGPMPDGRIEVVKYVMVDGERVDANEAPGPTVEAGASVAWEIEVSNTGRSDLVDIEVSDPVVEAMGAGVSCDGGSSTIERLPAGDSVTCVATTAELPAGLTTNVATATGTVDGTTDTVTASDVANVTGVAASLPGPTPIRPAPDGFLPRTGGSPMQILLLAGLLTAGGVAIVAAFRRRRHTG